MLVPCQPNSSEVGFSLWLVSVYRGALGILVSVRSGYPSGGQKHNPNRGVGWLLLVQGFGRRGLLAILWRMVEVAVEWLRCRQGLHMNDLSIGVHGRCRYE